jgi:hypothetical protein
MKTRPHHAPIRAQRTERGFERCANPAACQPGAHGNITVVDVCRCGAQRRANLNQAHYESSGWRRPETSA